MYFNVYRLKDYKKRFVCKTSILYILMYMLISLAVLF